MYRLMQIVLGIVNSHIFSSQNNCFRFRSFFELVKRHLGHQNAQQLSVLEKDAYPLLLVLIRTRGSVELTNIIEGKSTPGEVLLTLIQGHEAFEQQRQRDTDEEIQREQREDLKKQQEAEYNRSLQADLAKEQARLDQERKQKDEEKSNKLKQEKRLVREYFHSIFQLMFCFFVLK